MIRARRRWMLAARGAHDFYRGCGFSKLEQPGIFMHRSLLRRRM